MIALNDDCHEMQLSFMAIIMTGYVVAAFHRLSLVTDCPQAKSVRELMA